MEQLDPDTNDKSAKSILQKCISEALEYLLFLLKKNSKDL